MPKTPTGAKRPADVIGNAVHVMRIATRQVAEKPNTKSPAAMIGSKGGLSRAKKLSGKKRTEIAKKAANARWGAKAARAEKERS